MNLNEILPNLFLGSCPTCTEDIDRLQREYGITAVLNIQTEEDLGYLDVAWSVLAAYYRKSGVEVRRVPVRDFDPDHLRELLPNCACVLDELLRAGHRVYVHCTGGISRSPSTVIAYLHWYEGKNLADACEHVTRRRSCDPYFDAIRQACDDR